MQRVLEALGRIRLVTVERNRRADITADDAPLLVVMDGAHSAKESELPLGFFSLDVTIEYRTGDGQPYVTGG
jgi:hypothetical protein